MLSFNQFKIQMFRMYFGPVLLAAAPVAAIKTPDQPNKQVLFRPQELPIYNSIFEKHDKYVYEFYINFLENFKYQSFIQCIKCSTIDK